MTREVSVGMPVTAGVSSVALAVQSVLAQSFDAWELLIVDDGAPAETIDFIKRISDPRVRFLQDGENRGLPRRLNQITAHARAPYVARMDDDDIMHPLRLSKQLAAMKTSGDLIDVLGTRAYVIDENEHLQGLLKEPPIPTDSSGFLRSHTFTHPTVMMRREWAMANPYSPDRIKTEDKDLWLRSGPHSKYEKLDEPLLYYRIPRSLSKRKQRDTSVNDRKLLRELGPTVADHGAVQQALRKSMAKQAVFQVMPQFLLRTVVYSRKFSLLPADEYERADTVLRSIKQGRRHA